jgi:phenylpyruvate tautomerase PptA (4-oxalocrotonate tautomerase family)
MCSKDHPSTWIEKTGNVCPECIARCPKCFATGPYAEMVKEFQRCNCLTPDRKEKPYEILVVTSDFSWGKAPTLIEAMKKAYVKINTKKVFGYVGKDLTCSGIGSVTGSEIIDLGDLAAGSLFDRADLIEAVQSILDDIKGHDTDRVTCILEEIKEYIWALDEEAEKQKKGEEDGKVT